MTRRLATADTAPPAATAPPRPFARPPSLATNNPDAYDAYLRGLWHLKGGVSPSPIIAMRVRSRQAAVQELQRAVTLDPNFALARAMLASAYTQRFFYDGTDRAWEENAFVEIKQALALDPDLAEAYLARAQLTWNAHNGFPHEEAIIHLRRAVSINPNLLRSNATTPGHPESDAAPMAMLAIVYARLGRRDDAERMLAAVVPHGQNLAELSHMHHAQFHVGVAHGLLGRRDEAMRWLTKAADEGFPSYPRFSNDASLASMRGHPAFDALIARLRQDYNRWRRRL